MWLKKSKSAEAAGPPQTASDLSLYYFPQCPYCVRVLRALKQLNVDLDLRNTRQDPRHAQDLITGGGRRTVPCLRMKNENGSVQWMYESLDIVDYLQQRFRNKE